MLDPVAVPLPLALAFLLCLVGALIQVHLLGSRQVPWVRRRGAERPASRHRLSTATNPYRPRPARSWADELQAETRELETVS